MVLGHNQRTWDNAMTSSIEELSWDSLTAEQKDAAKIIGYSAEAWDALKEQVDQMVADSEAAYTTADGGYVGDDGFVDDRFNGTIANLAVLYFRLRAKPKTQTAHSADNTLSICL